MMAMRVLGELRPQSAAVIMRLELAKETIQAAPS